MLSKRSSEQAFPQPDAQLRALAQEFQTLRKAEGRGGDIRKRTERAISLLAPSEGATDSLAEHYFKQGFPVQVWPDTNGLKVDIGPEGTQGVHSHVPYAFLPEDAADHLHANSFIKEATIFEIAARIAKAHQDTHAEERLMHEQERMLIERLLIPEGTTLSSYLVEFPDKAAAVCMEEGLYVPESAVEAALADPATRAANALSLLHIASALNGGYQGADGDRFYSAQHPEAWRALHASAQATRFSKSVYASRSEVLHASPRNPDAMKLLSAVLAQADFASLQRMGIQAVRGAYKGGVEFVAFFSSDTYERILIDPDKHLRDEKARESYDSIPLVANSDFEVFEGFLLPYLQFKTLERELTKLLQSPSPSAAEVELLRSYVSGTISLLASHMSPEMYEPFLLGGKELLQALASLPLDRSVVDAFLERLATIQEQYGSRFAGASIPELLEAYLKTPERVAITFDEAFLKDMPSDTMREKARTFLASLPGKPAATLVKSGTEEGIPSVLAGKALRALGISARPTLVLIAGAKFENIDSQEELDAIATSIIEAAHERGANMVMQGGQSGRIVETIVRAYWNYRVALPEGEEPFRLLGIEPGQSTYAGAAGYPQREASETHPMLPIDSIHTPYAAGWSPGLEDIWEHTYLPHLVYRQELIRFMAEGYPATTLIINGGSWSVPECVESAKDNFSQVVMPDTGRLAAMLGHLKETFGSWSGVEGATATLKEFIAAQPEEKRVRMEQDLVLMQKRGLGELVMRITSPEVVITTDVAKLKGTLLAALQPA